MTPHNREDAPIAGARLQPVALGARSVPRAYTTAVVINLAAWRRLRRAPAGGQWWGGKQMWSWTHADQSLGRWAS